MGTNAQATVARVQTASGSTGTAGKTSWSMNINAPVDGDALICLVAVGASTTTNSVSSISQSGVTWQRIAMAPNSGGVDTEIWFAADVPGSAGTSITINTSSALQSAAVVAEYYGLIPAQVVIPVDVMAANSGANGTIADTGTTPNTTQPYELWFGGIGLNNSTNTVVATNNSFGIIAHSASSGTAPNPAVYALERIVSATGNANSGIVLGNGNANWNGLMVAFKPPLIVPTNQIAAALAPFNGVHPRLFLNASNVAVLRGKLNSGKYAFYWNTLTNYAMNWANNTNPPAVDTYVGGYGAAIGNMAFAYLLSTNAQFKATILAGAVRYATNMANWAVTNSPPDIGNYDCGSLLGLAMLYDYAYTDLDATSRQTIYNGLTTWANQEYQFVNSGLQNPTYVSNWLLVPDAGVLEAGLATFDQPNNSGALNWISLMLQNFDYGSQMLSPDGFGYEGVGYSSFAYTHFLLAAQLSKDLLNIDFIANYANAAAWSTNTGSFFSDFLLPRNSWVWYGSNDQRNRASVTFEDCLNYQLPPAAFFRGLAHHYKDTRAQWRADQVDQIPSMETDGAGYSFDYMGNLYFLYLLWYDDGVASVSPNTQPTMQVFTNMAAVSSRSDWSGDESLVTFKCGGPGGVYLPANFANYYNVSGARAGLFHEHPDAGSFCFYGGGDWLVQETGYQLRTAYNENSLLLDGAGQYGEPVINRVAPGHLNQSSDANYNPLTTNISKLTYASSTPAQDVMVGDAANAYAYSGQGVQTATPVITSFQRHLLFVKPNILIVGDNIQMSSANHTLELLFHLPNTNSFGAALSTNSDNYIIYDVSGTDYLATDSDGSLLFPGLHTVTRIDLLTPQTAIMTHGPQELFPKEGETLYNLATLVNVKANVPTQNSWTNVMAFTWAPSGSTPVNTVLLSQSSSDWVYQIGTHVVDLNWSATPTNPVVFSTNAYQGIYGTTNTIAALVGGGTGTVQFYVDGTNWGPAVSLNNGQTWLPLAQYLDAGTHTVMALYSGDATHASGSAASEATLTISPVPVVLSGTRAYDGTLNALAATLTVANNIDGTNLTLTGAGILADKHVGSQPISLGIVPTLINMATATATGTNTFTVTMPAKPTDGNTLVAVALYRTGTTSAPGVNNIAQTGAIWTRAIYTNGCGSYITEIWYATNVVNAGTNITLTVLGANQSGVSVMEYSGLLSFNPVDKVVGNGSGSSAGTVADTGTTAATTQANELWIAAVGLNNSGYTLDSIANGFTLITNALGQVSGKTFNLNVLQNIASTTGMVQSGGAISASTLWNGVAVAFKAASPLPPLSLAGSAASNYTLTGWSGYVTITNALLTVTGITASNKVYDGTTTATINKSGALLVGNLDGGNVVLNTAGAIGNFFPDGRAGFSKTVQISGLTISGSSASDYLLVQPTTTASITNLFNAHPTLILSADESKIYATPSTIAATVNDGTGTVQFYVGGSAFGSPVTLTNYSAIIPSTASLGVGQYSITASYSGDATHYVTNVTIPATLTITPRSLTINATGVNKLYDGTTTATVTFSDDRISGDNLTVSYTNASFSSSALGTNLAVSVSGISISGPSAGNYSLANTTASTTANISILPVILFGTRVYDGTINADASILKIVNNVDGTNLMLTGTGALAAKDVGLQAISIGSSVSATPTRVSIATATATSTTSYTVTMPAQPADGNTLIATTYYRTGAGNGVNSIIQTGANWTRAVYTNGCGLFATEIWYASNILGTSTNITVNVIGSNPSGVAVMEYNGVLTPNPVDGVACNGSAITGTSADTGATPATTQDNELWIGAVSLNNSSYTLSSVTGRFDIATNVLGTVSSKSFNLNVLEKVVNTTGTAHSGGTISASSIWNGVMVAFKAAQAPMLSLTGSAAGNYTLTGATASVIITNAPLTVNGLTAANRNYDGTLTTTLSTNGYTLTGLISPDVVTLATNGYTATFANENVGTNKALTIAGLGLAPTDQGSDYSFIQPTNLTANITRTNLTVTAVANTKVYDGTTNSAAVAIITAGSIQAGDTAPIWTQGYTTVNVGTGLTLSPAHLVVNDSNGGANYNYTYNSVSTGVINRNPLMVSGISASNKVYDGTTLAILNTNNVALVGNLDGSNVVLNVAGAIGTFFPDGSIGTNKTVQISGLIVSGSAANNYLLIQPTTTANIAAFKVALSFSGNPPTLTSIGNLGVSYITQRSTNLVNWVNISTNVAATPSGAITITDSFNDLGRHQPPWAFYRLN